MASLMPDSATVSVRVHSMPRCDWSSAEFPACSPMARSIIITNSRITETISA
jgi:hypothetical protein